MPTDIQVISLAKAEMQPLILSTKKLIDSNPLSAMVEVIPRWSPLSSIVEPFQQKIASFSRDILVDWGSTFKNMELLGPMWGPSIDLWNPFKSIDLFPLWGQIIDLTHSINNFWGALPEACKRWKENLKQRLLSAFQRIGFCFAPSMSEDLMYWVLEQVEAGNSNVAVMQICNYYAHNGHARLQQAVERWWDNPEFARRRNFISHAFDCHKNKQYDLSMRLMIPDVEGIAKQILKQNIPRSSEGKAGKANLSSPRLSIVGALNEAGSFINGSVIDIASWVRLQSTLHFAENEFVKKVEFGTEYNSIRNGKYPRNRHGNLHGIQLDGFTAANSLRLFLLLDAIYDLFQNYRLCGGIM